MQNSYLAHHGIKGQKWGVRRFQNEDGSLTPAGQKRYSTISPDRLRRELHSQIKQKRKEQSGNSIGASSASIGDNSKRENDRFLHDYYEYSNSPEHIEAEKKIRKLDRDAESGKISEEDYIRQLKEIEKPLYNPKFYRGYAEGYGGRKYTKEYLNTYGKDLNVAYLMDLGYSKEVSNFLNKRLMQSSKKLLS